MNETEQAGLANLRDRWIGGGTAAHLAPAEWQEAVAAEPPAERERLLLAVAGQALDVALRPAAPAGLAGRSPLPRLVLPTLPDALAPLLRTALRQASADGARRMRVVELVAARGFVCHPLDWMPPVSGAASNEDAPKVYAPWIDWRAQAGASARSVPDALTAENWEDFLPAARRLALADLRRADPARARTLLEAKAGGEGAEARLSLLEGLRVNLGADDAPYLRVLAASDRSAKVKQLAARLLARIGQAQSGDSRAEAVELAAFVEKAKAGLLRRRTVFKPHPVKSNAQIQRRAELFNDCRFGELAAALQAEPDALAANWAFGSQHDADLAFAAMAATSAGDGTVAALAARLLDAGEIVVLFQLLPRLGDRERRRAVEAVLGEGAARRYLLRAVLDVEPGAFGPEALMGSRLYRELRAAAAEEAAKGRSGVDLDDFGFLATSAAAAAILADLVGLGLGPADPSLALLRLNAALSDGSGTNGRRP